MQNEWSKIQFSVDKQSLKKFQFWSGNAHVNGWTFICGEALLGQLALHEGCGFGTSWDLSVWSSHHVFMGFLWMFWFPPTVYRHACQFWWIGNSNLSQLVWMWAWMCLFLHVSTVTDWQPVQNVLCLSPSACWDKPRSPETLRRLSGYRELVINLNFSWGI